jgi:hypothetical protein
MPRIEWLVYNISVGSLTEKCPNSGRFLTYILYQGGQERIQVRSNE